MTNVFISIGNLVKDPEYTVTGNGTEITKFTLAVNRKVKSNDGVDADFIRCICFSKIAKSVADYTRKGSKVAIEARVTTGSYDKDGQKVFTTDFICNSVQFLTPKSENGQAQTNNAYQNQPPEQPQYQAQQQQTVQQNQTPQGNFNYGNGQPQQNYNWSGQQQPPVQNNVDPFANSKGLTDQEVSDGLPF